MSAYSFSRILAPDPERAALLAMYPCSAETMPESLQHHPSVVEILIVLYNRYEDRDDVLVAGNSFIYYREGDPRAAVSPDCYVVLGLDLDDALQDRSYFTWRRGKAPDFVLEVGSEYTAANDLGAKRDIYAEMGASEYWLYDSSGGDHYGFALRGERLVDGAYEEIETRENADGMTCAHSAALALDLCWDGRELRLYDPATGEYLLNRRQTRDALNAAEDRADAAEDRADAAEAEVARLRAQLAQLGQGSVGGNGASGDSPQPPAS